MCDLQEPKRMVLWADWGFSPWGLVVVGHGNSIEICLADFSRCCCGWTVVRTNKEGGSACCLQSLFMFLLPCQLLLDLCGVRLVQQELWEQEKWVVPSFCASSQSLLGSGVEGARTTKPNENPWEFLLCVNEGQWAPEFGFYKDSDSSNMKYLFLSNKSMFLFVTSKNWSDTGMGLALASKFLVFIQSSF